MDPAGRRGGQGHRTAQCQQIAAAAVRAAVAAQDLRKHDLERAQRDGGRRLLARQVHQPGAVRLDDAADITACTSAAYELAYDVAKRAEQAYRHELGIENTEFVQFGYWNGLRRGLGAGEQLLYDLKRMEVAYLNENRRELEITKHVSLRQLDGAALLRLRADGECEFEIPEAIFDLDFPGTTSGGSRR